MKKEFLILIPDDENFCNSKKAFVDFLNVDSLITVSGQTIIYKRTQKSKELVRTRFHVDTDKVKSKQERYFLLTLDCRDESLIEEYSELCDRIKSIVERLSPGKTTINTLWDDVGRIYAEKSYPIINDVENQMRRLIAKFMLITVGVNWSKDVINPELFKKIENFEEEELYLNDLHKLDFIHLKQVLFDKKRDIGLDDLDRLLLKTEFSGEDKEKILKYVPRSNWDKYFSSLLEPKDSSIEGKWASLYKLRNKVAHNRHVKREEFEQIRRLASQIKEIIGRATAKLGDIDLDEQERTQIINSYPVGNVRSPGVAFEAVAAHYGKAGFEILFDNRDLYDFSLHNNTENIAVFVKSLLAPFAEMVLKRLIVNQLQSWFESPASARFDRTHVVMVLRGEPNIPMERLIHRLVECLSVFGGKVTLEVGALDDGGGYFVVT